MSFTEIVVEMSDARYPLFRATKLPRRGFAVYRVVDDGQASHRYRAIIAYQGARDSFDDLLAELREAHPHEHIEVAHRSDDRLTLTVQSLVEAGREIGRGFSATSHLLHRFGIDTQLEPIVFAEGRARMRLLVTRTVDAAEATRAIHELQRITGFPEMRVTRTEQVEPAGHVDLVRRLLPAEQEDLLDLANAMGYYSTPKRVTLDEIAKRVGLSISPVHKRLKAAEETLVDAHIQPQTETSLSVRRRVRRDPLAYDGARPQEVTILVRAPGFGPSDLVARTPGSRALLQLLSDDPTTGQATAILTLIAAEDVQSRHLAQLQARADVVSATSLGREKGHLSVRLATRGRTGYGLGWWTEAWGADAFLRPMAFVDDTATLRLVMVRPVAPDLLAARLADMTRLAGWDSAEVTATRPLDSRAPPPESEPLTARQTEVLRIAHALGYYRTPRSCTLEQVAGTLGVSANAIHKNLVLAESKLIARYLAAGL